MMEEMKYNIPGSENIKNQFKVPDGYFEAFPRKMQDRIQGKKQGLIFFRPQVVRPVFALASIAIVAFMVYTFLQVPVSPRQGISPNQTEDLLAYELSENQIIEYLVTEQGTSSNLTDEEANTIIDYVSEQDITIDQLSTEL